VNFSAVLGSPPYSSPELFNDDHYFGKPVDIWAMGILLYFILIGNMPFSAPTVPQLRTAILKGQYRFPGKFSASCAKLIRESTHHNHSLSSIIHPLLSFFLSVVECILLHNPAQRPTVDLVLRAQWLQRSAHRPQSPLAEARTLIQRRKKASFWCSKSRKTSPMSPNHPMKPETIECYTKKYNNVPIEKFKNPLESQPTSATTVIPINNLNSVTRNNSLINSSKIILKRKEQNGNGRAPVEALQINSFSNDQSEESEDEQSYDFSQFMMMPTRTNCDASSLRDLDPLEQEARKIMRGLGIKTEVLEKSIDHGPRSEIIGIYRIIIMRLKTQKEQSSQLQAISPMLDNVVKSYQTKKNRASKCAIL
jgi:serine/threonine-protein kinase NIM1